MSDEYIPIEPDFRDMPDEGLGFKVAFSFAGEQRDLVREIAKACEQKLGRGTVFFDEWFEPYISGMGADMFLQSIYGEMTQMMVLCVAKRYAEKPWTMAEHDAIMSRAMQLRVSAKPRDRLRFLPIRVGEGEVPGVLPNAITLDARDPRRGPVVMAEIIARRLAQIDETLVPRGAPRGKALILPCIGNLAPLSSELAVWLDNMDIAVFRPDPLLPVAERADYARRVIPQVNVIVEWFQHSEEAADRPFIECHQQLRDILAQPATSKKSALMWLPDGGSAADPAVAASAKRMLWEQFKRQVHDAAISGQMAPNRIVIGAAQADAAAVQLLVGALPRTRPKDPQYDELHLPPDFDQMAPDVDDRIQRAIRKSASSLVLVDGSCSATWIDERLRAYDLFRGGLAQAPKLIVWDVPQTQPKQAREYWPDDPNAVCCSTANAADVIAALPVIPDR
jgi:hypothetical protein